MLTLVQTHILSIITVTSKWVRWRLKSPFIQAKLKENINAPRHWPLCAGNSPVTGEFPAQMASNAENVSTQWRHHVCKHTYDLLNRHHTKQ